MKKEKVSPDKRGNKRLFYLMLIFAEVVCIFVALLPVQSISGSYTRINTTLVDDATYAFTGSDGSIYAVDAACKRLLCLRDGYVQFAVMDNPFGEDSAFIADAEPRPDGGIYVHYVVNYVEAYTTKFESICLYGRDGSYIREIFRQSYENSSDPPHRNPRICGIGICGDDLRFAYIDENKVSLYEMSAINQAVSRIGELDGGVYDYLSFNFLPDGSYSYSKRTGEVGCGVPGGETKDYYRFEYDIDEGGELPYYTDGKTAGIYVADINGGNIFYVTPDGNCTEEISYDRFVSAGVDAPSHLSAADGILTGTSCGRIWQYSGGVLSVSQDIYPIRTALFLPVLAKNIAAVIGVIILAVILVYTYKYIFNHRISLFIKQLAVLIPAIVIMITIGMVYMYSSVSEMMINDLTQRTMLYCATTAGEFNGDDIAALSRLDDLSDEKFHDMFAMQNTILNNNLDEWNRPFYNAIYLMRGDTMYMLSISNNSSPNLSYYDTVSEDSGEWKAYYEGKPFTDFATDFEGDWIYAQTPIRDSAGNIVALYEVGADLNNFYIQTKDLLSKVIIKFVMICPLVLFCISLMTYYTVKYLRNTGKAVEQIADGDFSVRIHKLPRDEIGDISTGVNKMAEKLLVSFSRSQQLRDIYFKYVPVQFMELLGKDDIMEVNLGDALSLDVTILFFDIRKFSLNSEMMTAKENFSFINKVSGLAGPIIRSYNGFIDKYIGDAVMALFTDAYSAVAAGVELYKTLVVNDETNVKIGDDHINIGIGIHSGMSMLGIIGEKERLSNTVISENVNLSSRLESLTKQFDAGMIISKDTLDRMEKNSDRFTKRFLGMIQVAGVNEIKALFEVLDCLDEKRRTKRTETKDMFESGVRKFHLGNLEESLECFRKVREADPTDKVVGTYMDYISEKIQTGNTDSNYFRFTKK